MCYYHHSVEDFAQIARPLTKLTGKSVSWKWDFETQEVFDRLKDKLTSTPILGYPDPKQPYILDTNASQEAVGGVLSQRQDEHERVIAYFTKTHSAPENTTA